MGHTEIEKSLPYEFEVLHLSNRDAIPVGVALTKATFAITASGLHLAEKQQPIFPAGQHYGKPGESSYRYEPEYAYYKPATDVVLIADAYPPKGSATQLQVEFEVGSLRKKATVWGDRFWYRSLVGPGLTDPQPFASMPLTYERAFGGWDRSHPDPERHQRYAQNPVGMGFQADFVAGEDRVPLPNIEDSSNPTRDIKSRPPPVGFGFTSPDWQPRAALAGTFDKAWEESRAPRLPLDFDERFFNAASSGLIANGYLAGNETVRAVNCSPRALVQFKLPDAAPPACRCRIAGQDELHLTGNLDTVVVNLIDQIVTLTWRCHFALPRGPGQLKEIAVTSSR